MKKRENMVGVLVIRVPLCLHLIDILGAQKVFLKKIVRREFQFIIF